MLVGCVALFLCIPTSAVESTPTTRLDATEGNPGKHLITYITSVNPNKSPQKTVAVVLSRAGKQKCAYVYRVDGESITLDLVSGAKFTAPMPQDGDAFTKTCVRVTKDQFVNAKKILKSHIKTANKSDSPEIRFYNCISDVLRACDMKLPYRSPYRPPNLTQWIGDIPAYSRDKYLNALLSNIAFS
jgi:hypothetical protein